MAITYDERVRMVREYFHILYYTAPTFQSSTRWMGIPTQKCPLDLWIYQEIIVAIRPDLIVECGTYNGGSALYLAQVCDGAGQGHVLSIDIQPRLPSPPPHPRITYLVGSTVSPEMVAAVAGRIQPGHKVMVILDSDHHKDHVLQEMRLYGPLVTAGSYLIVEDTQLNGHPVAPEFGPGPAEAVAEFLRDNRHFVVDAEKEKLLLTFNPGGYLLRTGASP